MNETGKYGNLTETEQGYEYLGLEIEVLIEPYTMWYCGIDLDMGEDATEIASGSTLKDMLEEVDILIETEVLDEGETVGEEALVKRVLAWVYK